MIKFTDVIKYHDDNPAWADIDRRTLYVLINADTRIGAVEEITTKLDVADDLYQVWKDTDEETCAIYDIFHNWETRYYQELLDILSSEFYWQEKLIAYVYHEHNGNGIMCEIDIKDEKENFHLQLTIDRR